MIKETLLEYRKIEIFCIEEQVSCCINPHTVHSDPNTVKNG